MLRFIDVKNVIKILCILCIYKIVSVNEQFTNKYELIFISSSLHDTDFLLLIILKSAQRYKKYFFERFL